MRGYFGIGILNGKKSINMGTLYRTAYNFGAAFTFTIGHRYIKQSSDTNKHYRHLPLFEYINFDHFLKTRPLECLIVAIEINENAENIYNFKHPERCIYLLGAEDHGIPQKYLELCNHIVKIPGRNCHNVCVAGAITMYDRLLKYA